MARELGSNARFMRHDVTDAADWDAVVKEAEAFFGPINILVNNADILGVMAVVNPAGPHRQAAGGFPSGAVAGLR